MKCENQIADIEKQKETRDMLGRFSKRAVSFTPEKIKYKFEIPKWVQLEAHNHSKIDSRGEGNPKRALWYSNPKTRLVGSLGIFGEIHIRVCWYWTGTRWIDTRVMGFAIAVLIPVHILGRNLYTRPTLLHALLERVISPGQKLWQIVLGEELSCSQLLFKMHSGWPNFSPSEGVWGSISFGFWYSTSSQLFPHMFPKFSMCSQDMLPIAPHFIQ